MKMSELGEGCFSSLLEIQIEANYNCYFERKDRGIIKDFLFKYQDMNLKKECLSSSMINVKMNKLKKQLSSLKGKNYCYKNFLGECDYFILDNINYLTLKQKKQKDFENTYMSKKVIQGQVLEVSAEVNYCVSEKGFSIKKETFSF